MKHQPVKQGQTTTQGTLCPTLCEKCMGSLTFPANWYREDAGDRAYGKKARENMFHMMYDN